MLPARTGALQDRPLEVVEARVRRGAAGLEEAAVAPDGEALREASQLLEGRRQVNLA